MSSTCRSWNSIPWIVGLVEQHWSQIDTNSTARRSRVKIAAALKAAATMLLAAAAGGVLAYSSLQLVSIRDLPPPLPLTLLFLTWLVLAIHEAGHLIGGSVVGFRVFQFACGPVMLVREGERLRLRLNRVPAHWGGLAGCMPVGTEDLRRRTGVFVAGGPLTTLLSASVALVLAIAVADAAWTAVLAMFATLSIGILFATLIPATTGGIPTDGARLIRLFRGGPDADRDVAIMALMAHSRAGVKPAAWDTDLVQRAVGTADGTMFEMTGRGFAVAHHLDAGRLDLARDHMTRLAASAAVLPAQSRPAILLEAAFMAAWYDFNPGRARELLADATPSPHVPRFLRLLAEAAMAIREGDTDAASRLVDDVRAALDEVRDPMQRAEGSERLALLYDALQAPAGSAGRLLP
jgi:hypothetical protein